MALPSAAFLCALVLAAIFAPTLSPYDPQAQDLAQASHGFSAEHLLGADQLGRDLLSRVIYGGRVSLTVGVLSVLLALAIGTPIGFVAGYIGGSTDRVIVAFTDFILAFPRVLMAIIVVTILGPGLQQMILAIGIWGIPIFARLSRVSSLAQKRTEYVVAARSIGVPTRRMIMRHIVPNSLGPLIVTATLSVGVAILTESGLSFLGLGVPPETPAWGLMMADGRVTMRSSPHIITIPGIAIVLTVLAFNWLGDGLREAVDPALRT